MFYKRPKICNLWSLMAVLTISAVLIGCGSKKNAVSSKSETEIKAKPQIVFLNYAIKKNEDGNTKVEFLSSKKVEGKLKNQKRKLEDNGSFEDLICSQFDAASTTLSQQLIKNPLKKEIEYVDETKNFKVARMELDSAEFTVRLQLYPQTKYIAINLSSGQHPLVLTKVNEL